jgi:hypothetical protein
MESKVGKACRSWAGMNHSPLKMKSETFEERNCYCWMQNLRFVELCFKSTQGSVASSTFGRCSYLCFMLVLFFSILLVYPYVTSEVWPLDSLVTFFSNICTLLLT